MRDSVLIVGGGAAGIFAAVNIAELAPGVSVTILETDQEPLRKVAVSGGGRCNLTHDCRDPRELARHYPRGSRELRGMFSRFAVQDTIDWFAARGVLLKTEADGRMFPETGDSATITGCLLDAARRAGVEIRTSRQAVAARRAGDGFAVELAGGEDMRARCLLLAGGGMRGRGAREIAEIFGHTIVEPVPSLFTFDVDDALLKGLAGVAAAEVAIHITEQKELHERGPLLITHRGLSGPAILKLSSLGARTLAQQGYRFELTVNWAPFFSVAELDALLAAQRSVQPRRRIVNSAIIDLPNRLWERLVTSAGISRDRIWSELRRHESQALTDRLQSTHLMAAGRSLNKEEFVTCGGVRLDEVDLRRMESRLVANLFFAGEVLDIDGLTGGFNLQAAWTGGWIAAAAIAGVLGQTAGCRPA